MPKTVNDLVTMTGDTLEQLESSLGRSRRASAAAGKSKDDKSGATPRKPRARNTASPTDDDVPTVTLRSGKIGKSEIRIGPTPMFRRLESEWGYRLRHRRRWSSDEIARDAIAERAFESLLELGIDRRRLNRLLTAHRIEVEVHPPPSSSRATAMFDAASAIPWEYLISAARRARGGYHPVVVSRLLRESSDASVSNGGSLPIHVPANRDLLFLESAPGRLRSQWDFSSEERRIENVAAPHATMHFSRTETVDEIAARIEALPARPRDIHVTGIDPHLMAQCYSDSELGDVEDGMVLRDDENPELIVPHHEFASLLVAQSPHVRVVTLNLYYSGTRTARECIRAGAEAAIGIVDEIDDSLAEYFFQVFYRALFEGGSLSASVAFESAWRQLANVARDDLRGTGIVLWTRTSIFAERVEAVGDAGETDATLGAVVAIASAGGGTTSTPSSSVLKVQLDVAETVNYSLLHNDRPLLAKFTLDKLTPLSLANVSILVELQLGDQCYPYRTTIPLLEEAMTELARDVKIPLTGVLPRSLKERVQTTLYARVTCDGLTVFEDTRRVTLLPVDEWLDDTTSNPWLPSFVLPRDPTVQEIIRRARRYLIALSDDPAAGFDGYQSVTEEDTEPVDRQVQAIWVALTHEYRLQYVNPPPSYSEQTQRLRTPADIVTSNSGTCVDLSLLLASCLEYIGIYSVVILLDGHAFAGYWRSEDDHQAFREVAWFPPEVAAPKRRSWQSVGERKVESFDWRLTRQAYLEIMEYVRTDALALLEATFLTAARSFAEALEEGAANLVSKDEFDSLLDVQLARTSNPPVTPLPVLTLALHTSAQGES